MAYVYVYVGICIVILFLSILNKYLKYLQTNGSLKFKLPVLVGQISSVQPHFDK